MFFSNCYLWAPEWPRYEGDEQKSDCSARLFSAFTSWRIHMSLVVDVPLTARLCSLSCACVPVPVLYLTRSPPTTVSTVRGTCVSLCTRAQTQTIPHPCRRVYSVFPAYRGLSETIRLQQLFFFGDCAPDSNYTHCNLFGCAALLFAE